MFCLSVSKKNLAPGRGPIPVTSREQAFVQRAPQVRWAQHQLQKVKPSKTAVSSGSGKTRRIWKPQEMKSVRHKGTNFYFTVLLFLMTCSGLKSAWLHSLGSVFYGGFKILWDNQVSMQENNRCCPQSSRAQSDPSLFQHSPHFFHLKRSQWYKFPSKTTSIKVWKWRRVV